MTRQDFANRWGFQPAKGYGSALFDCRESLLKDLDAVIANEVKNLDLPHVRLSLFNYIDSLNDEERISLFKEIKEFRPEKRGWCSKCGMIMPEECNGFH